MKFRKSMFCAVFLGALLLGQSALGTPTHDPTPTASSVIASAEAKAASENKNVFVLFHASWCGWCHKLDDFLARPEIAPLIDANYVTVHIVVQENGDKKDLDNPGGDELLDHLGGKDLGIPYYAILSPKNDILAVSKDDKGQNIGYPGEATEIPIFMKMLRTTSHQMSDSDADMLNKKLVEAGAKIKAEEEVTAKLIKPIQDALASHDYKTALASCEGLITSHPDLASFARYERYEALLHVDENKALSEFGQPMGETSAKDADGIRASMVIGQDSLSDRAYEKALPIILASAEKDPGKWYTDSQIARAYSRVHQVKKATEYQDKAIDEAKAAKLPQKFIDNLVKAEQDWQKKGS